MKTVKRCQVRSFIICVALLATAPVLTAEPIVYVHGAWNGGFSLRAIERLLRAEGHDVYRPTLTGQGERVHLATPDIDLDLHIQDVVNVILWEDLKDVILIGRSYGGMVITGVADRVPDRINRIVYIDAFLPQDGESVMDITPRPVRIREDGFIPFFRPEPPGTSPPHTVPQPGKTFTQKIRLHHAEAAARVPVRYILTVEAGRMPEQDEFFKFSERARTRGWEVVIMEADHAPESSRPDALLPLLLKP